jgi:membrane protease YdiL (CAAX protease family)
MTATNLNSQESQSSDATVSDRTLASWELISVVSSIVIAEWMFTTVSGLSKLIIAIPVLLALTVMIFSHRARNENLRDIGFRFDNFFRAMRLLILPMVAGSVVCVIIGWRLGATTNLLRWHPNRLIIFQLILGFGWGLVQQYALQGFLNRRATIAAGPGWRSILIVAVIFACLHLPNPALTVITLVGGAIWAAVYQRAPNLFALAVSHSVMTWLVVSTLPPSLLHHLRVGLNYFS